MPAVRLGNASDIPAGKAKKFSANKVEIAVFNVDGKFFAIQEHCTHSEGPLHQGELEGSIVTCPLHGAQFDVTTGKVLRPPAVENVKTYKIIVKGKELFAEL